MNKTALGFGSLLLATFIYGFFGILSRIIGFSLPLFYQSSLRSLLAGFILFFLVLFFKQWKPIKIRDYKWIIIRSFFGIVAIISFFIAVNFIPLGTTYFIFYAGSTLGGYLIGQILYKEKLTKIKIVSLILSLVGLYFIYSSSISSDKIIYSFLSLLSGLSTAIWNTFPKKISGIYSSIQLTFLDNIIGAVIGLVISLCFRETWILPVFSIPWKINMIFGILYIFTGQLIIYGFKYIDAQSGSLIMLTEVLFGIILGFLFYKEIVSTSSLIGGLIVISAIILPQLNFKKRS